MLREEDEVEVDATVDAEVDGSEGIKGGIPSCMADSNKYMFSQMSGSLPCSSSIGILLILIAGRERLNKNSEEAIRIL